MDKKNRFSFWKVCFWVTLINVVLLGFMLTIIYFVKLPAPQAWDPKTFPLGRFLLRGGISLVFQCIFDYYALNQYYRVMARKGGWPGFLLVTLVLLGATFAYYLISDLTLTDPAFGQVTSMQVAEGAGPRQIQLTGRITF